MAQRKKTVITEGAAAKPAFSKAALFDLVVVNPGSTFVLRVRGEEMESAGIKDGDMVIVDSSLRPHRGSIVVVERDREYVVERSQEHRSHLRLVGSTPKAGPEHKIVGVVTFNIAALRDVTAPVE